MLSTESIYSPECMAVYKATGQTRYPNMHVWVEGIGKHIFETERDVYTSIPLNIKIAGNASSARGNVQLNVAPTDKTWYDDACSTIAEMVKQPSNKVSLCNTLGVDIKGMSIDQLAHAGEIDVYVSGKRHLLAEAAKVPRYASPHKIEHLTDWYETHRDGICNFVADQMNGWSQQQVESNLVDGGKLEQSICKYIEENCCGPAGESWPQVVSTYGMDKDARSADAHRSAQVISKQLIEQLTNMLRASREQVLSFYAAQQHRAATAAERETSTTRERKSIFKDPDTERKAIPLRNAAYAGVDTDDWADAKQMFHDLAIDAFDSPALRDRIVVLMHRQPHQRTGKDPMNGGAPLPRGGKRHIDARPKASPLGNPVKEHIAEFHMPFYGKHAMDGDDVHKNTPFYGDYHETLNMYHLYTGRHPHPMSMVQSGSTTISSSVRSTGPRLEKVPRGKGIRAFLVPVESLSEEKIACGMHKKGRKKKGDDDDEYSYYDGKHKERKGATMRNYGSRRKSMMSAIDNVSTLSEFVQEFGGGSRNKARQAAGSILAEEKLSAKQRSFFNRFLGELSSPGLASKMKARTGGKARLVPISDDEVDVLPDFEDFL